MRRRRIPQSKHDMIGRNYVTIIQSDAKTMRWMLVDRYRDGMQLADTAPMAIQQCMVAIVQVVAEERTREEIISGRSRNRALLRPVEEIVRQVATQAHATGRDIEQLLAQAR